MAFWARKLRLLRILYHPPVSVSCFFRRYFSFLLSLIFLLSLDFSVSVLCFFWRLFFSAASVSRSEGSCAMCSGSEAGSYLRLIDSCITRRKAQGPFRTCNESKEEEEEKHRVTASERVLRNSMSD